MYQEAVTRGSHLTIMCFRRHIKTGELAFYSGKHRKHGMNLRVISAPDDEIVWVSGPLPGAVHDLTAPGSGASSGN